jgi:N-acetylglutamate synthase-like GNAT family acetyltransferase
VTMLLRPATDGDVNDLVRLRTEAAQWLAQQGSDQWALDWPDPEGMRASIRQSILAGETWCVETDNRVIGTITLNNRVHLGLWTDDELREPARYAHRMIITRTLAGAGLGAELLDWAGTQAAHAEARWLRVDVWTTNRRLQDYYRQQGFTHVRTVVRDDYPSGALFQRPAEARPTPRLTMQPNSV